VFCFWWFLNVSLAVCGWAAACCPYFARAAYGHLQAVGWLEAPFGVHAHLGVGLRRMSARRFICGISALHNKHGGGAERLNKDKAHTARRFINAEILDVFLWSGLVAVFLWVGVCGAPLLL
jgi:hypothetical protein